MQVSRGAVAAALGCCLVYAAAVVTASAALALVAPPLTAAAWWVARPRVRPGVRSGFPGAAEPPGDRLLLEQRVAQATTAGHELTLLSLRLDGLEEIGHTLGVEARERVLTSVVGRVRTCLDDHHTVVRLGTSELSVLLPSLALDDGVLLAERLLVTLRRTVRVGEIALVTPASIGIAHGLTDLDDLLRAAGLAERHALDTGGDRFAVYRPELLHDSRDRLSLVGELRNAVTDGQLRVHYQPIVDADSGRVRSVEALVRWEHPVHGLLPPTRFLPAAERAGLMPEIGSHVLEQACAQLARWRRQWPDLAVAVNVSEAELLRPDFAARVLATLRRHRLPTAALHLEVTETVAVDEATIESSLVPLANAGVACSLDDFGTGYSSLHRLRQLPVQRLKIDKSFVDEVGGGRQSAPLLASIIALAHSVGRSVVAEGVETADQATFLLAQGCDELQGYLYSRPVPAAEVPRLLTLAQGKAARPVALPG